MAPISLAGFVTKRPWLHKALMPIANWYANAAGYRQIGLRYVLSPPSPTPHPPLSLSLGSMQFNSVGNQGNK